MAWRARGAMVALACRQLPAGSADCGPQLCVLLCPAPHPASMRRVPGGRLSLLTSPAAQGSQATAGPALLPAGSDAGWWQRQ